MSQSTSDSEEGFAADLFGSDEESIPEVEPTFEIYSRDSVSENDAHKKITIKLVGSHPLWAHHLWNASKVFASLFDKFPQLVQNKTVLELGAGGALPSIVATLNGAKKVVVTDYPDKELIDNIQYNVDKNLEGFDNIIVEGYVWGTNTEKLVNQLLPASFEATQQQQQQQQQQQPLTYDVIILSDLVFNHSQHHAMLKTCRQLLTPKTGRVYVFYTHHRPHLADRDLQFFEIAKRPVMPDIEEEDKERLGYGFKVDYFWIEKMNVMFEEDPGDEEVRATVHGWQLWLEDL
ncbi:hypothetical protein BDF20DRAFT_847860 [Mycotypha africana]|uniref:uncharacterized protein n=1 Tax=Mycotypha africana TaxID=64632 RepID=UPI002301BCC6|nr:uncharacterized protein BDF20DRAFT_847860 [Mycotypha africana]KAI8992030.1 hypothetical protein BDF20DRAFT_847860 [Mycotypha africana]